MSQRTERIAGEVRAVVTEVLARQEIKDPRVRGAGLITVTHVRMSGDLRHARALFTVHGAGEAELERVREGLDHASGYFRHTIGARLRMKVTPQVTFEVDRVFDQATRVETLLREIATAQTQGAEGRGRREQGRRRGRRRGRGKRADLSTGVLVIDKPVGPTSFDVVRQVRRALGTRRVGHGGTLDPMASGVLPICLGEATQASAQFLLDADKEYEATLCFGVETDTFDATGTVTEQRDPADLTEAAVARALDAFRGPIRQVPPRYSALKLNGRPLYDYARAGEEVEPAPRTVVIHELALVSWSEPTAVVLRLRCSKGTLRAIAGVRPGSGASVPAHTSRALRRTRSGPFRIDEAHPLSASWRRLCRSSACPRRAGASCRPCAPAATLLAAWSRASGSPGARWSPPQRHHRLLRAGFRFCVRTGPCWPLPRCARTTRCTHCACFTEPHRRATWPCGRLVEEVAERV